MHCKFNLFFGTKLMHHLIINLKNEMLLILQRQYLRSLYHLDGLYLIQTA